MLVNVWVPGTHVIDFPLIYIKNIVSIYANSDYAGSPIPGVN
jgi:hypothetical protein